MKNNEEQTTVKTKKTKADKIAKKENKILKRSVVREEFKVKILTLIKNFKSKEVPNYKKLSKSDIVNVLSSIMERTTQ